MLYRIPYFILLEWKTLNNIGFVKGKRIFEGALYFRD